MEREMLEECRDHFGRIDKRLEEGDLEFREHERDIIGMQKDVSHLTKSLDGVSKALWGVALAIITALIGFSVWVIENGLIK